MRDARLEIGLATERGKSMKIGIVGAGNIGANAARLFVQAGHEVAVSNSRGPESLRELVEELGDSARATSVEEAARFGEVVLLAVPWRSPEALPPAESLAGKIVVDAMNPYGDNFTLYDLGDSTSSEEVAKRLPGARLVKAFNTIYYVHLAQEGRSDLPVGDRRAIFVAGDDEEAKAVVSRLIEEIGFAPVDTGSLREGGRRQEPNTEVYNRQITGEDARKILGKSAS
jgi:8-hydroxy-5-deazaflavin:NADPH oxidoreductase